MTPEGGAQSSAPPTQTEGESLQALRDKANKYDRARQWVLDTLRRSKGTWRERRPAMRDLPAALAEMFELTADERREIALDHEVRPSVLQRTGAITAAMLHKTAAAAKYLARWKRKKARKAIARLKRKKAGEQKPPGNPQ